jgi:ABC-2 type transport system permease protein
MTAIAATAPMIGATTGPRIRLFVLQALAELRGHLRAPDFAAATIALPIVLYFIFGAPRATEPLPGGGTVGQFTLVGFAIYGVLSVVLFGLGETVASERGRGYVRLVRVTPLPVAAYFGAKLVFAALASGLIVGLLGVAGALTGAGMPLDRWIVVAGLLALGGLALAPIGFLVGFLARPNGAGAVALLLLFPLALTAGTFMPIDQLPAVVRQVAEFTPTYHLAELARWEAGFSPSAQPLVDVAWVLAGAAAAAAVVVATYRRLVGRQFA